ncbi:DUF3500 domain-containing protein [Subtercola boreus]|uniref:DUF3500 domain-containing protein n=1 Tax=Subtercola boreus TaxID=120213 RepID=A0A3E0WHC1_9MICO|nr:DUF3500 domain-containing protein [Subtercola boreus]RFA23654.1 hypothetical protein B7R24_01935 [Subtercola boreus]RFA24048.1 hypothetical protein B7R23_01935 [Subtercola boreus]RFA29746.1 hypothetical protein B7R25_01930 [Subtercola boreus]
MTSSNFRDYLYSPDDARVASLRGLDARAYAEQAKTDSFAGPMIEGWAKLYPEPYVGLTTDGEVQPGLFDLREESAPVREMTAAASSLLAALPAEQTARLRYPLDAHEWRTWANPEFMQHDTGLRLDELADETVDAILAIVEATLSPEGYRLVRDLMYINGYLGAAVELPALMNERSYNFALYGEPSRTEPWGWQLFGHHVALNAVVIGGQLVLSPVFLGAEPSVVDDGPRAGLRVFDDRIHTARELMRTLEPSVRQRVISYAQLVDPAMPPGRIHAGDERHLGGCFRDNAVVPYEGVRVTEFGERGKQLVLELARQFFAFLPAGPAAAKLAHIEAHFDETRFSWIGGHEGAEPFYFRIQSPVTMLELDHHTGVFLSNDEPGDFHIHTVIRTPNANDYGRVLVERATGRKLVA